MGLVFGVSTAFFLLLGAQPPKFECLRFLKSAVRLEITSERLPVSVNAGLHSRHMPIICPVSSDRVLELKDGSRVIIRTQAVISSEHKGRFESVRSVPVEIRDPSGNIQETHLNVLTQSKLLVGQAFLDTMVVQSLTKAIAERWLPFRDDGWTRSSGIQNLHRSLVQQVFEIFGKVKVLHGEMGAPELWRKASEEPDWIFVFDRLAVTPTVLSEVLSFLSHNVLVVPPLPVVEQSRPMQASHRTEVLRQLQDAHVGKMNSNGARDREIILETLETDVEGSEVSATFITADRGIYGPLFKGFSTEKDVNLPFSEIPRKYQMGFSVKFKAQDGVVFSLHVVPLATIPSR